MTRYFSGYAIPDPKTLPPFSRPHFLSDFVADLLAGGGRVDFSPIQPDAKLLQEWHVRNQGQKPTCVAFATAAAIEHLRYLLGAAPRWLSTHFVYYNMRVGDYDLANPPRDYDKGSTMLEQAKAVLETEGVCPEAEAPYGESGIGEIIDGTLVLEGHKPPHAAFMTALAHTTGKLGVTIEHRRFPGGAPFGNDLAARFHAALENKRSVAVGFMVFPTTESGRSNLETLGARTIGLVRGPGEPYSKIEDGAEPIGGHAVCLVGFHSDKSDPVWGGGWFIFRNSVGTSNFAASPDGSFGVTHRGYGAISAAHLAAVCHEYLIIG